MTAPSTGRNAALGVRHSGWAAAILVARWDDGVEVMDRRRIELCDGAIEGSKQPFHTAEPMPYAQGEAFLARCRAATETLACAAVEGLTKTATGRKYAIIDCGLLCASDRTFPPLRQVLASHALIHAAEGVFYREAVALACAAAQLRVIRIRERDALRQAADATDLSETKVKAQLAAIGKGLGAPWTEDQKLATLAAWIALGSRPRR